MIAGLIYTAGNQRGTSEAIEKSLNLKIDQHIQDSERSDNGISNQVQKLWEWKDAHEKDASNMRLELQKQIGKVESSISVHDGQYGQIISLISEIKSDIKELKNK